jgi:chloramphenicol 3-O-phosphotransferase
MLNFERVTARKNSNDKVQVSIRPGSIFDDAYAQIQLADSNRLLNGINVSYVGEEGKDEGGITRQLVFVRSNLMKLAL